MKTTRTLGVGPTLARSIVVLGLACCWLTLSGLALARSAGGTGTQDVALAADVGETTGERMARLVRYIEAKYPVSEAEATLIVGQAFQMAERNNLDPELILAVIAVESTFRPKVVSQSGARGLMQIVPKWHPSKVKEIGGPQALFDPEKNIYAGSQILLGYLEDHQGNLRRALLKYNGSLGNPTSRYADRVLSYRRQLRQVAGTA